jgi:hypothetical protein
MCQIHSCDIEVERECTSCHAEANPAWMPSVEPGDLLRHESGRTKRQQQWRSRGPTGPALFQHERRHLKGLRHVTRKSAVVLTRHDTVEAAAKGKSRLLAEFAHDCISLELVVGVQANRD